MIHYSGVLNKHANSPSSRSRSSLPSSSYRSRSHVDAYNRIWNTRTALHKVLMMYEEAIIGSFTSCRVVKMRAVDPQRVHSQVINDSYDQSSSPLLPVQCDPA